MAEPDAQLMLRFQRDGDRAALASLVERNGSALLRFLIRLSRNRAIAEDVAQQTWLKVIDVARSGHIRGGVRRRVPHLVVHAGPQSLHRRVPAQVRSRAQRAATGRSLRGSGGGAPGRSRSRRAARRTPADGAIAQSAAAAALRAAAGGRALGGRDADRRDRRVDRGAARYRAEPQEVRAGKAARTDAGDVRATVG